MQSVPRGSEVILTSSKFGSSKELTGATRDNLSHVDFILQFSTCAGPTKEG